ncbi:MAG: chromosomal replication initiator protein DnaA [Planctomycetia bacterium]
MSERDQGTTAITSLREERLARLLSALRARVTQDQYETWLQGLELVSWEGSSLVLAASNAFRQRWIQKAMPDVLAAAASEVAGGPVHVSVVISAAPPAAAPLPPPAPAAPAAPTSGAPGPAAPARNEPAPFVGTGVGDRPLVLGKHYTFENFIVGPSNNMAHASAQAVAQEPGRAYNPLFIHGPVGLGKTHLLHAVCHEFLRRCPGERVCFLSCEEFINEYLLAVRTHAVDGFRARFRDVRLLVIDDIHFLAGKERTQEEFFHLFNRLYQQNHQIVISSDAAPSEIPTLEDRLVSRFKWGLVANLEQPEMETRMAILRRKAELQGVDVPAEVVEFIAANFRSNIREIEGALLGVVARARVTGAPVDLSLAQQALAPSMNRARPAVTMDRILEVAAAHWQVKPADLRSKKRTRVVSLARQVVMSLARRLTSLSLWEIGQHVGGRDHTTVLYGIQKVEAEMASSPRFKSEVDRLADRLA